MRRKLPCPFSYFRREKTSSPLFSQTPSLTSGFFFLSPKHKMRPEDLTFSPVQQKKLSEKGGKGEDQRSKNPIHLRVFFLLPHPFSHLVSFRYSLEICETQEGCWKKREKRSTIFFTYNWQNEKFVKYFIPLFETFFRVKSIFFSFSARIDPLWKRKRLMFQGKGSRNSKLSKIFLFSPLKYPPGFSTLYLSRIILFFSFFLEYFRKTGI